MSRRFGTYSPSQPARGGTTRTSRRTPKAPDTPTPLGTQTGTTVTDPTTPRTDAPGQLAANTVLSRPSSFSVARPKRGGKQVVQECERLFLGDRASTVEVIARQVALQMDDPKGLVEPDDVELVLDRLEQWHRLASESMDGAGRGRVLEHTQRLSRRLAEHTHDTFTPLKARCLRLIETCLDSDTLRARYGVKSRLRLGGQVDADTGQWHWTSVEYPIETPLSNEESRHEQRRFFADIDRLLQSAPPVPWAVAVKALITTLKKFHWVADYRVWLSWTLHEARRGHMEPMVQQLKKTEEELGLDEARKQLAQCLDERIRAGMPWSEKIAITDAVQADQDLRWGLSANDEWSLRMTCAQGGDAAPMLELLNSRLPLEFIDRARLEALLTLCQNTRMKNGVRIDLIAAARPYLDTAPDLCKPFDDLLGSFTWRPSSRKVTTTAFTPDAQATADELVRQARKTVSPWFTIDTRQPPLVTVRTSPDKAPVTAEARDFEAALATWMKTEARQQSLSWRQLLDCIDEIERIWRRTIDRDLLLDLCIQQVERTGDVKALQDHLPKLLEAHPSRDTLLKLLAIASRAHWSPVIRAALIPHLLAWVRPSHDAALHHACIQAILSLPADNDILTTAIRRFVAAYGGDDTMARLFGTVAQQHGENPPNWLAALRVASHPPAGLAESGAWLGWRALCRTLFDDITHRLLTALVGEHNPTKTADRLFDALSTLSTPESGHQDLAVPQLFDLLGDLARAVPQDQRAAVLEHLLSLSLTWPGAPVMQAALRGALQALLAHERANTVSLAPSTNTNQFVIDEATVLFTHGFLHQMAMQRGEDVSAQVNWNELTLRWDRSGVRTHAPDMAALIAKLFGLQNLQ